MQLNTYTAEDSYVKRKARNFLIKILKGMNFSKITGLTLAAQLLILERNIVQSGRKALFYTAERNPESFITQRARIHQYELDNNVIPYHGDIFKMIHETRSAKFNFVWLDFCGIYTKRMHRGINRVFDENKLQSQVLFAITVSGRRERTTHRIFYQKIIKQLLNKNTYTKSTKGGMSLQRFRKVYLTQILEKIFNNHKYLVNRKWTKRYTSENGTPMAMHIYHIVYLPTL